MDRKFVGQRELMEALGLSARSFRLWVLREGLTVFRLNGRVTRYDRAEVDAALERASRRAPAPPSGVAARSA